MREDDELGAVIAAFLEDAAADRTRSREELRQLRRALTHVDTELGSVGVGAVGGRDVLGLVDELGAAGLPASRTDAIVDALRAVFAYAIAQGIVKTSPLVGLARPMDGAPLADGRDARARRARRRLVRAGDRDRLRDHRRSDSPLPSRDGVAADARRHRGLRRARACWCG